MLSLTIRVEHELSVAERTASLGSFALRHLIYSVFLVFVLSSSEEADSLISVEGDTYTDYVFELMALEYASDAV